jgi:hypothetical protein
MAMRPLGVYLISFAALACAPARVRAQATESVDLTAVGKDGRWKVIGRSTSIVDVKGNRALELSEGPGVGIVSLDGYNFVNGVIELDILGRSQPVQGSFVGVAFHVVDANTYEAVYFRPFNFRAADSIRHSHAVQYVSEPTWGWQRLRSERPGQYEQAVVPEPNGDEWFHVRIVVERPKVRVFVNDRPTPALVVDQLGSGTGGSIGVWVGEGSGGHFANFRVTRSR